MDYVNTHKAILYCLACSQTSTELLVVYIKLVVNLYCNENLEGKN